MFEIKKWTDNKGRDYDIIVEKKGKKVEPVKVSAIMLTHNSEDYLEYCIRAIHNQVDKIYVLDDGSLDNTINILEKYDCVDFITRTYDGELDLSKRMNDNLKRVPKNQWLLYVNPDEILYDLPDNYIGRYCHFLQNNGIYCSDVRFPDFIYNYGTLFAAFDWGEGPGFYWTARRLFYWTGEEEFHHPTHYNISNLKKGDFFQRNNEHTGEWEGRVVKTDRIQLYHYGKLRGVEQQRGKEERITNSFAIAWGMVPTITFRGNHPSVMNLRELK